MEKTKARRRVPKTVFSSMSLPQGLRWTQYPAPMKAYPSCSGSTAEETRSAMRRSMTRADSRSKRMSWLFRCTTAWACSAGFHIRPCAHPGPVPWMVRATTERLTSYAAFSGSKKTSAPSEETPIA